MNRSTELAYNEVHYLEMKLIEMRNALRGLMHVVEQTHGKELKEYQDALKALSRNR